MSANEPASTTLIKMGLILGSLCIVAATLVIFLIPADLAPLRVLGLVALVGAVLVFALAAARLRRPEEGSGVFADAARRWSTLIFATLCTTGLVYLAAAFGALFAGLGSATVLVGRIVLIVLAAAFLAFGVWIFSGGQMRPRKPEQRN